MAYFSLNVKILTRSNGNSVTARGAYINGIRLNDNYSAIWYDHSSRKDVITNGIMLPDNAPERLRDFQTFYDELNRSERRKDDQLAQSIILALPIELSAEEQMTLLKAFCQDNFVNKNRCVNFAIHSGTYSPGKKPKSFPAVGERKDNPHSHLVVPFRGVDQTGFRRTKLESRSKNHTADLLALRESWAILQNLALERAGFDTRVTHESYAARGIDLTPTRHIGAAALANELKGVPTRLVDDHLRIIAARKSQERDRNAIEAMLQQRVEQRERERLQAVSLQHTRDQELLREKDRIQELERERDCRDFSRER